MKPVVVFSLTDFNSVDHMVPVAYKLVATGKGIPLLLFTDAFYDIDGDYRLDFLKRQYGVGAEVVFTFHQPNPVIRWIMAQLCRPLGGTGLRSRLYPKMVRVLSRAFYRGAWARGMLKKYTPGAFMFERSYPGGGLVGALVREGKKREVPSISLPHGLSPYTNELLNEDEVKAGSLAKKYYRNLFDYVVYQSDIHSRRSLKEGLSPDKAVVLGSARFCDEWAAINQSIQVTEEFKPAGNVSDRLKVVFMLTQWNINVHRSATIETLNSLSKMASIYLAVKPHPRQGAADLHDLLEHGPPSNVEVVWDVPSPSLIRWSDVVLNIGSSIALEALQQRKALLQLNYLHSNTTVYEETNSCWNIENPEELVKALEHLARGGALPYGDQEVSKTLSVLVLGGSEDTDVLRRYVDFILGAKRV